MNISFNSNLANMTSVKARRQKFGIGSLIIMIIIGVVFLGIGKAVVKGTSVNSSWTKVTGSVVSVSSNINNGSTTYTPVVQYTVNGQQYQVTSSISSSAYPAVGSTKQVAYNPSQPSDAKVVTSAGQLWFVYLFPVVGVLLVIGAPILFVRSIRRSKDIKSLQQTGTKLQGILSDVLMAGQTNTNGGGTTYKMVVTATNLSGQPQNFTSDTIRGIGGITLAHFQSNPIPIDVYVNPSNPNDYYVDISDIPELTPEKISELIRQSVNNQHMTFTGSPQAPQSFAPTPQPAMAQPAAPVQFMPQAALAQPAAPTALPGSAVAPNPAPAPEPAAVTAPTAPPADVVPPTPPSDQLPPTPPVS